MSQIAAALQHSIIHVLRPALSIGPEEPLRQFLGDVEAVAADRDGRLHATDPDILARFRTYDDDWLMQHLRTASAAGHEASVQPWLDLVCWRSRGPRSLWKRAVDFPGGRLREFNEALPDPNDPDAIAPWRAAVDELEGQGVLVIRHRFSPYGRDPGTSRAALKVSDPDGNLMSLTDVSHLTAALPGIWSGDVQVYAASSTHEPDRSPDAVVRRLEQAIGLGEGAQQ